MNVEYINSFYKAISEVLKRMVNSETEMGKIEIRQKFDDGKTGVLINILGDLDGYVVFNFPDDTALNIVNTMSGLSMDEIDEFVYSALSELVNIISGNAITNITEVGKVCDISTPKIYSESIDNVLEEDTVPIKVPIKLDIGNFDMNIYVKELDK